MPPPHPQPRETEGEQKGRGGFGDIAITYCHSQDPRMHRRMGKDSLYVFSPAPQVRTYESLLCRTKNDESDRFTETPSFVSV